MSACGWPHDLFTVIVLLLWGMREYRHGSLAQAISVQNKNDKLPTGLTWWLVTAGILGPTILLISIARAVIAYETYRELRQADEQAQLEYDQMLEDERLAERATLDPDGPTMTYWHDNCQSVIYDEKSDLCELIAERYNLPLNTR